MAFFRKQGVAWAVTAVMIAAAVVIGLMKAGPRSGPSGLPPGGAPRDYIRDDANVLSADTENVLANRNAGLIDRCGVAIAVITCNYGGDDLGGYVDRRGRELNLGRRDFIVVLDIRGDDYWLGRGEDLARDFTDGDCMDYAWDYMEDFFAVGDYDGAVLSLTEMLEAWYGTYFG